MNVDPSTPVLVTGANGYIASQKVRRPLDEGLAAARRSLPADAGQRFRQGT